MSLMLVAVALASFSADQIDRGSSSIGDTPQMSSQGRKTSSPAASSAAAAARSERQQSGSAGGGSALPAPGGSAAEGDNAAGEHRICRRIPITRTHRYRRVCLTAQEWRRFEQ